MPFRHVGLMILLMACGFLVVGQLYVTIPLVGEIASRFGVEPGRAALVGSAFGIAYAAGFLVFGPLSDRMSRKTVLVAGLVATGMATAFVGIASGFGVLLVARGLQGLAASAFPPAALSLLAESLPAEQRPFGVSLMSFAFLGAAPLAQFFAAQVSGGLSAIMFELAPLYMIGAVGLLLAARHDTADAIRGGGVKVGRLRSLVADKGMVAAWGAAVTVLFGFVSFHAGVQALNDGIGLDLQALRLVGLPPLLLTFAAAPLMRRFGATATARTGLLVAALSLSVAIAGTPGILILASILLSAGVAFAIPGLIATVAGRADNSNRGLALAVYSFILFLGASFAPPVAQALAHVGAIPLWLLPIALLLLGAFGLAAARKSEPSNA